MADEEAVFVVGIGRSGTSALRTALHRLPAFQAVQARSPETRVFAQPQRIGRILEPPGRRLLRYLLGDEAEAARLLESLATVRLSLAPARRWWAQRSSHRVRAWRLRGHHHHVRLFFHHAQRARRSPRILEKTPHHWRHMDEIQATFPRARIVMCMRHPVDVMSSLRKRHQRESERGRRRERLRWLQVDADGMAERFREIAAAVLAQQAARPGLRYLLRYEDLTASPENALAQLCAFLEEPYDPQALLGVATEQRDVHGSPQKGSRIAANRKLWEEWVTPAEASAVENAVGPEMDALGYTRYTSR